MVEIGRERGGGMSWWSIWEAKTFEEFKKEYYNWMGVEMPKTTTDQEHEVRLRRLEQRMDSHIERDPTPRQTYCCEWMWQEAGEGRVSPVWVYCPKCGRRV